MLAKQARQALIYLECWLGVVGGQHSQRMAQIDHVIDARVEEIFGGGAGKQHSSQGIAMVLANPCCGTKAFDYCIPT